MDLDYYPATEPATPDYVLAVLRFQHRQLCHEGMAESDVPPSFEMTVAEWREACDLLDWQTLGQEYNAALGIDCSDAEWFAVLEPAEERRLVEVCRLIAVHATRPRVRPARLLGKSCGSAGAFLTVRSMLHQAGAPVAGLTPSSPLAAYTRSYPSVFLMDVPRLAPEGMPPATVWTPVQDGGMVCVLLAIIGLVAGITIESVPLLSGSLLLMGAGIATIWFAVRVLGPSSVRLKGLQTFRDLAHAIDRAPAI